AAEPVATGRRLDRGRNSLTRRRSWEASERPAPRSMESRRPDPDALLARVAAEEASERRGRLKVFLGAAPGVGKTFAMLNAARELESQNADVVIGIVETHGRR